MTFAIHQIKTNQNILFPSEHSSVIKLSGALDEKGGEGLLKQILKLTLIKLSN